MNRPTSLELSSLSLLDPSSPLSSSFTVFTIAFPLQSQPAFPTIFILPIPSFSANLPPYAAKPFMMSTMTSWTSCRAATSSLDRIDTQMRTTSSPVPPCPHHRRQNPSEDVPTSSSSAFSPHSSSNSTSSFYSPYDGSSPFSPSSPKQTFEVVSAHCQSHCVLNATQLTMLPSSLPFLSTRAPSSSLSSVVSK